MHKNEVTFCGKTTENIEQSTENNKPNGTFIHQKYRTTAFTCGGIDEDLKLIIGKTPLTEKREKVQ